MNEYARKAYRIYTASVLLILDIALSEVKYDTTQNAMKRAATPQKAFSGPERVLRGGLPAFILCVSNIFACYLLYNFALKKINDIF